MKCILFCKACSRPLSRVVAIVSGDAPGVTPPALPDQEPIMPRGSAFESHQPWCGKPNDKRVYMSYVPQIWMNLDDLLGEVRYTPHTGRLSGCCGLSDGDGPNRICECGNHIGTEFSECYTPRMFVPDPSLTRWEDVEEVS
jgi:hypothetical protein